MVFVVGVVAVVLVLVLFVDDLDGTTFRTSSRSCCSPCATNEQYQEEGGRLLTDFWRTADGCRSLFIVEPYVSTCQEEWIAILPTTDVFV